MLIIELSQVFASCYSISINGGYVKGKKILSILFGGLAFVGCGQNRISNDFRALEMNYHGPVTSIDQFSSGVIKLDVKASKISFKFNYGGFENCEDLFLVSGSKVKSLKSVVSETEYIQQEATQPVEIIGGAELNLIIDAEIFKIQEPIKNQNGKFIFPENACAIKTIIRTWIMDRGYDNCPASVIESMLGGCEGQEPLAVN